MPGSFSFRADCWGFLVLYFFCGMDFWVPIDKENFHEGNNWRKEFPSAPQKSRRPRHHSANQV